MPTVEGLTPSVLWTTMYGIIAMGLLFLIGYKVYDAVHTIRERKKQRVEAGKPDFAEKVSQKVIADLGPRFEEIEENLKKDKKRLETHEQLISSMKSGQDEIHAGLSAIAEFMLAISLYGNIGENENVKKASADLQKYLAHKI